MKIVDDLPAEASEHTAHDLFYDGVSRDYTPPSGTLYSGSFSLGKAIAKSVFGFTVATVPLGYLDPRQEFRQSTSAEIRFASTQRLGRPITLAEARRIALRILADTELRLADERARDAAFWERLWTEED